jgi:hypothetical protein
MLLFGCNRLSPLQRQTVVYCATCVVLVAVTEVCWVDFFHADPNPPLGALFAILSAAQVAGMVYAIGRYLGRETDEFIRAIVVQSMLWAFGIMMVIDIFLGVLLRQSNGLRILPILNIDIFCVVAPFALRIQLWRNR